MLFKSVRLEACVALILRDSNVILVLQSEQEVINEALSEFLSTVRPMTNPNCSIVISLVLKCINEIGMSWNRYRNSYMSFLHYVD
jgi:hypothetical protein